MKRYIKQNDIRISELETKGIIQNVAKKDKEIGNMKERLRDIEYRMRKSHKFLIRLP